MMLVIQHIILWSAFLVSTFSARWSLPILAFCLPFTQWFPDIPVPGLNALNLLLLPPLARAFSSRRKPNAVRTIDPILIPASVFVVFCLISWLRVHFADVLPAHFIENDGIYGNFVTIKEILLFAAFYFCARRLASEPDDLRRSFLALAGAFAFEALTSAREFLFSGSWRATGHLGHPNKLGAFMSAYIMMPIGILMSGAGKLFVPTTTVAVLGLLGILASVSRGALVAVGGAVLLLAALRRSAWIIVFGLVVGTAPYWLPEKIMGRFSLVMDSDSMSGEAEFDPEKEGRVEIWECGGRMIADNPIFGVGLGMFPYHLREYGYTHRALKSSHNIYIQLSAEQGILCGLAHVTMMLIFLGIGLRVAYRHRERLEGKVGLGFAGVTVGFMLSSIFGDAFYENNLSGMFWVLGGLVVNIHRGCGFSSEFSDPQDARDQSRGSIGSAR